MKSIIKYMPAVVLVVFAAVSCEYAKFLDQYPYSQTSPENFYTSAKSMNMALTSCYEVINGHKIPGASYVQRGSYGQGLLYIMNCPSDDMVAATSSSDEGLEMTWGNYNESTRCVRDAWKVMYTGINRCNTILHYIPQIDMPEETRTQYVAEARFLRAFFTIISLGISAVCRLSMISSPEVRKRVPRSRMSISSFWTIWTMPMRI